jgi:hypothetical protein
MTETQYPARDQRSILVGVESQIPFLTFENLNFDIVSHWVPLGHFVSN